MTLRIGLGYDAHRFAEDRPLILGGVTIPYTMGLLGHSDADVLTHTIMDAMLGALTLGSIGQHFPDTDPAYKNSDSMALLDHVHGLIQSKGYGICNCDSVLVAQEPKLNPYIETIQRSLSDRLGYNYGTFSVKATTTEKMGPEGRLEGISCHAVVLLSAL